jgi:ABC-type transport system involved in multi-copper enzyme maturation permease subunit
MNTTISSLAPMETARLRDRFVSLFFGALLLFVVFRPITVNDFKEVRESGPPLPPATQFVGPLQTPDDLAPRPTTEQAWINVGSDALCFLIVATVLFSIIVGRAGSIAYNTFREAVRNRILYFILFFSLIMILASGIVKELAVAEHRRIVTDLGLGCISFFGFLIAVFVGISLVYNELERKTIYTIVSKPVHRYQFLLGKYFGLLLTIYVNIAVMALLFFIELNYQMMNSEDALIKFYQALPVGANVNWLRFQFFLSTAGQGILYGFQNFLGFASPHVSLNLLAQVGMICLQLMIITAYAILFSSFSTPTLSAVFTVMTYIAGTMAEDLMRLARSLATKAMETFNVQQISDLPLAKQATIYFVHFVSLAVPNLDGLDLSSDVIHKELLTIWRYPILYAFCHTGMILMLSVWIFSKRNFK